MRLLYQAILYMKFLIYSRQRCVCMRVYTDFMIHLSLQCVQDNILKDSPNQRITCPIKEEATPIASEMSRKRITPTESGEKSDAMLGRYLLAALLCVIGRKLVPEYWLDAHSHSVRLTPREAFANRTDRYKTYTKPERNVKLVI